MSFVNMTDVYLVVLLVVGVIFAMPKYIGVFEAIVTMGISLVLLVVWGTFMKYIGLWRLNIYVADLIWVAPIYLTKILDLRKAKKTETNKDELN